MKKKEKDWISLPYNGTISITAHTIYRWEKKITKLGYLAKDDLRKAVENLRRDMLKVLKDLGD
jgi:hypothetical protein